MSEAETHEYPEADKPKNKRFILQGHNVHMVKREEEAGKIEWGHWLHVLKFDILKYWDNIKNIVVSAYYVRGSASRSSPSNWPRALSAFYGYPRSISAVILQRQCTA